VLPLVIIVLVIVWALRRGQQSAPASLPWSVSDAPLGTSLQVSGNSGNASWGFSVVNPSAQSQSSQLDNFSQAIATLEGFGIPGARPTRDNNPGDLKFGPGMTGRDEAGSGGIAVFADVGDGWDALNGYITQHAAAHPEWDFYDFAHYYATGNTLGQPAAGEANPDSTAETIAGYLGVDPSSSISSVLG